MWHWDRNIHFLQIEEGIHHYWRLGRKFVYLSYVSIYSLPFSFFLSFISVFRSFLSFIFLFLSFLFIISSLIFIHPFLPSFIHSFIHSFNYSFTLLFLSFIHLIIVWEKMSSPQCIVTENKVLYEVWQCAIDFCLWPLYFFDESDFCDMFWFMTPSSDCRMTGSCPLLAIHFLNSCHSEFVLRNMKYIWIFYYFLTLRRHRCLDSFLMEDEDLC